MTDQRGVVHSYSYDELGRMTQDSVTFPMGGDVDETIDRIDYTFDDHGRLWKATSYGSSTPKNGVLYAYNHFDQVVNEYQNHSGAATTTNPDVVYSYDDSGSGSNSIRLESTTYPDNTTVGTWDYGTSGAINDLLGRVEKIKESSTTVCSYRYLGLGTAVGVKYEAASNLERSFGTSAKYGGSVCKKCCYRKGQVKVYWIRLMGPFRGEEQPRRGALGQFWRNFKTARDVCPNGWEFAAGYHSHPGMNSSASEADARRFGEGVEHAGNVWQRILEHEHPANMFRNFQSPDQFELPDDPEFIGGLFGEAGNISHEVISLTPEDHSGRTRLADGNVNRPPTEEERECTEN